MTTMRMIFRDDDYEFTNIEESPEALGKMYLDALDKRAGLAFQATYFGEQLAIGIPGAVLAESLVFICLNQ